MAFLHFAVFVLFVNVLVTLLDDVFEKSRGLLLTLLELIPVVSSVNEVVQIEFLGD